MFFQLKGFVTRNPDRAQFTDKMNLRNLCNILQTSKREQQDIIVLCPCSDGYDSMTLAISWNTLFFFPKSCFLQADVPLKVNFADVFCNLASNPPAQKALFHRIAQEVHTDKLLLQNLVNVWNAIEAAQQLANAQTNMDYKLEISRRVGNDSGVLHVSNTSLLDVEGLRTFCVKVDKFCHSHLGSTFRLYNDPNISIVSPVKIRRLTQEFRK
jgi:hypothetical protein